MSATTYRRIPWGYDQPGKRLLTGALVTTIVTGVVAHSAECPSWRAGIPCPTCGMSRATTALLQGDLGSAVENNPLFWYWLGIAVVVFGGFTLYATGFARTIDQIGKRGLDAIPAPVHAAAFLVSWAFALAHYGINPDGWLVQLLRPLAGN